MSTKDSHGPQPALTRNGLWVTEEEFKRMSTTEREAYYEAQKFCEKCGAKYDQAAIPCPQNKPGCMVSHMGSFCPRCGHAPHGQSIEQANHERLRKALGVGPDRDALRDALRDLVLALERSSITRNGGLDVEAAITRARALLGLPPEESR